VLGSVSEVQFNPEEGSTKIDNCNLIKLRILRTENLTKI
jgi:hypothetical protein